MIVKDCWSVNVFSGYDPALKKTALGNLAQVYIIPPDEISDSSKLVSMSLSQPSTTHVFVSSSTEQNTYRVRWYNNGNEIQRCGHGSLAAAALIFRQQKLNKNTELYLRTFFNEQFTVHQTQNETNNRPIAQTKNTQYSIDFPQIKFENQSIFEKEDKGLNMRNITPQLQQLISVENTLFVASTKDIQGYTLIELDTPKSVENFKPSFQAIKNSGKRAILVTALVKTSQHKVGDIGMFRYFAPQHGVNEDSATGSAAALVAQYFFMRNSIERLILYQASPNIGGLMNTLAHKNYIRVTGSVEFVHK